LAGKTLAYYRSFTGATIADTNNKTTFSSDADVAKRHKQTKFMLFQGASGLYKTTGHANEINRARQVLAITDDYVSGTGTTLRVAEKDRSTGLQSWIQGVTTKVPNVIVAIDTFVSTDLTSKDGRLTIWSANVNALSLLISEVQSKARRFEWDAVWWPNRGSVNTAERNALLNQMKAQLDPLRTTLVSKIAVLQAELTEVNKVCPSGSCISLADRKRYTNASYKLQILNRVLQDIQSRINTLNSLIR
jgi:hypothetical protein